MMMILTFMTTKTGIPQQMIIEGKLDDDNDDEDDKNLHDNKDRYSKATDYWREKTSAPP